MISTIGIMLGGLVFALALPVFLLSGKSFSTAAFRSFAGFVLFYLIGLAFGKIWNRLTVEQTSDPQPGKNVDFKIEAEFPNFEEGKR